MGKRGRIGVVDDHTALILGVSAMFRAQHDLTIVAAASTVPELLQTTLEFDLVLLDLSLSDGSNPAGNLRLLAPLSIPVLAYTSGENPALVRLAARYGAVGMIRKSEPPGILIAAVRTALRGDVVASQDWAAALDSDNALRSAGLTSREAEVLELYASGESADQVATLLFISRETVLDHVKRIRAKYATAERSAPTKVDLYRRAVEDGFVDIRSGVGHER